MSDELEAYDAGLLADYGGGDVNWWQDYIRAELGRAHDFYASQIEAWNTRSDEALQREVLEARPCDTDVSVYTSPPSAIMVLADAIESLHAEAEALRSENARLRAYARKAEQTFRWYGDLHAAKPDMEKAKRNYDLADEARAALGEQP